MRDVVGPREEIAVLVVGQGEETDGGCGVEVRL